MKMTPGQGKKQVGKAKKEEAGDTTQPPTS
jgi:hypothetical protein